MVGKTPKKEKKDTPKDKVTKAQVNEFMAKLNKDTAFRNKFLDDPVGTLRENHFPTLKKEDARNLEAAVNYLRDDINHMFEIPSGSRDLLAKLGFGIQMSPGPSIEVKIEDGEIHAINGV